MKKSNNIKKVKQQDGPTLKTPSGFKVQKSKGWDKNSQPKFNLKQNFRRKNP